MCSYYDLLILLLLLSEVLAIGTLKGFLGPVDVPSPLQALLCFLTPRMLEAHLVPSPAQPWNRPCPQEARVPLSRDWYVDATLRYQVCSLSRGPCCVSPLGGQTRKHAGRNLQGHTLPVYLFIHLSGNGVFTPIPSVPVQFQSRFQRFPFRQRKPSPHDSYLVSYLLDPLHCR